WTDAINWTPNSAFPVAGDTATFNFAGANGTDTIFLNGNQAAASLTFSNTGTTTLSTGPAAGPMVNNQTLNLTNGITVNSGAGAVSIGTTATNNNVIVQVSGSQTILNNSAALLTIGGALTSPSLRGAAAGTNVVTLDGSGPGLIAGVIANNTGTTALIKNGS